MALFVGMALLVVLLVLGVVLRPLWRSASMPTIALAALVLLAVGGLYALLGTPAALDLANEQAPRTLDDAIGQLQAALLRDPKQAQGWRLLGSAYAANQQLDKARDAYAHAAALLPDAPDVLVEAAEASALASPGRQFDPQAVQLLQHALDLQPTQQRARWFLGIAQRQAGKPAQASATWQPLLAEVDPRTAAPLRAQINAARAEAGLPALAAASTPAAALLRVDVRLDPSIALPAGLPPAARIYVIARKPGGPPMPVAVEQHGVQELPFTAELDDSDGPMPTQRLSTQSEVELVARLSRNGAALPQPGDLESQPVRVHLPSKQPVQLTIGTVRR